VFSALLDKVAAYLQKCNAPAFGERLLAELG
jgi:hypothetical protein